MFNISNFPKNMGTCSCDDIHHGNRPKIKSIFPPALTAMMQGWDNYCLVKDYDDLAKEELIKETFDGYRLEEE